MLRLLALGVRVIVENEDFLRHGWRRWRSRHGPARHPKDARPRSAQKPCDDPVKRPEPRVNRHGHTFRKDEDQSADFTGNTLLGKQLQAGDEVTPRYTILGAGACYLSKNAASVLTVEPRLPQAPRAMPMLEFVDSNGVTWRVWNTVPTARTSLSGEFERGWLTFESAGARKRLAPVPPNWEASTADRLELMCRAASEVPRRTRSDPDAEANAEPDPS